MATYGRKSGHWIPPYALSLAGVPIHVSALYPTTKRFCKDYLSKNTPALSITLTQEDIEAERRRSELQDITDGVPKRSFLDSYLETLALYRKLTTPLLERDILVFHGAAVVADGWVYLFTAPSGTGKTTHVRLWLDQIPGAYVLNGDKPLLKFTDKGVWVCGTPWQGKENMGRNEILPLKAICILERGDSNQISAVGFPEALSVLTQQVYRPADPVLLLKTLKLMGKLSHTNLFQLRCNMEKEAAWVSYQGMNV